MFSRLNIFKKPEEKYNLSIIIPTYNVEDYIETCMNSVVNQSLDNFEIICIDDCSTDSTVEILKRYQRKYENIRIIENNKNRGPGYSRNMGLEVSNGDYICFIDSDDWIEDNSLEHLYNTAREDDLDLLFYKLTNYDNDTGEYFKSDNYSLSILKEYENKIFNYHDLDPNIIYSISVTPHGKLYKRSLIIDNNIRFLEDKFYEDNVFFNDIIFKAENVSVIDYYPYIRRIRQGSVMQDHGRKLLDDVDIMEQLLKNLLKDNDKYNTYHEALYNYMLSSIRKRFLEIDPEYMNEFYDHFKEFIQKCVCEYNVYNDMVDSLIDNNLAEFNLCIKSIDSDNYKIREEQVTLKLEPVISVVYDSSSQTSSQIKEVIKSIACQKFGFFNLEILLIDESHDHDLLAEYEDTYDNIRVISVDGKNKYIDSLKYVNSDYVLFVNDVIVDDKLLFYQFKEARQENLNLSLPDDNNIDFNVENILFRKKFIDNDDKFTNEDGIIGLNPIIYVDSTANIKLLDLFRDNLEKKQVKTFDSIINSIRTRFVKIEPKERNDFYKDIKEFVKTIITEYDNESFISHLNKNSREFYELVVKSLESSDETIRRIQEGIKLDIPVCIMVYIKDNPKNEIRNMFNSIVRQSFGFEHLEVLFIDNNSQNTDTVELLDEFNKLYVNVNSVTIDEENQSPAEAYNVGFENTSCPYVMFTDNKHILVNNSVKKIFKSIRKDNMHMVVGILQKESTLPENTVFTNIIKGQFINDRKIKFKLDDDGNVVLSEDVLKLHGIIRDNIPVVKK